MRVMVLGVRLGVRLGVGSAFAVSAAALVLACATPNLPDDTLGDDSNGSEPAPTKTPAKKDGGYGPAPSSGGGSGSSAPTPTPTPPPTGQADAAPPPATNPCASSASQSSCYACCEQANPAGIPFLQQAWGACVCEVPGACALACADEYCAGQGVMPGGSCDACLAANGPGCDTQADNACAADATCKQLFACDTASSCASKP